jgi:hypothetical protein
MRGILTAAEFADGEDVFLVVDPVAIAPELYAAGSDFQPQAISIGQLVGLRCWFRILDGCVCKRHRSLGKSVPAYSKTSGLKNQGKKASNRYFIGVCFAGVRRWTLAE